MDEGRVVHLRMVVIDDHRTFAELLASALDREPDLDCVGVAHEVETGVALCAALTPEVVVLDYRLPGGDGLLAAERILGNDPGTRILMLTGDPTAQAIQHAASVGICGFLPKDGALGMLLEALRMMRAGDFVVAPALISGSHMLGRTVEALGPNLTAREMDVLRLMSSGHDVTSNARLLGISAHTCRGYVKSILRKLDAHSQLEAVAVADRMGMLAGR